MKLIAVILPLIAVLAKSTPVEYSTELPTSTATRRDRAKIQAEHDKFIETFADSGFDHVEDFCKDQFPEGFQKRALSSPGLRGKFYHFMDLVLERPLSEVELFCSKFKDSTESVPFEIYEGFSTSMVNFEDRAKIQTECDKVFHYVDLLEQDFLSAKKYVCFQVEDWLNTEVPDAFVSLQVA